MIERFTNRLTEQNDPILKAVTLLVLVGSGLVGIGLIVIGVAYYRLGYFPLVLVFSVAALAYVFGVATVTSLVIYWVAGRIVEATGGEIAFQEEQ